MIGQPKLQTAFTVKEFTPRYYQARTTNSGSFFLGVFRKLKVGQEKTQAQFWAKNSKYWSQLKILSKKVREI